MSIRPRQNAQHGIASQVWQIVVQDQYPFCNGTVVQKFCGVIVLFHSNVHVSFNDQSECVDNTGFIVYQPHYWHNTSISIVGSI